MRIPPNFAVVTPYIVVDNADFYVQFLKDGLGGIELGRSTRPDGTIANCQVRFYSSTVMISEASAAFPTSQAHFYFYVEDADSAMQRAILHGALKIMDVSNKPYGDRQGGIKDPAGNVWWISQRLVDGPYF